MHRQILALLLMAGIALAVGLSPYASAVTVDNTQPGAQVGEKRPLRVAQQKRGVCPKGYRYDYRSYQCVKL
jgi:hypothetical protein